MGKVDFSGLFIICQERNSRLLRPRKPREPRRSNYGVFLQSVFDFIIIAFVIFLLVKQVNRFKKEAPPATTTQGRQTKRNY